MTKRVMIVAPRKSSVSPQPKIAVLEEKLPKSRLIPITDFGAN